MASAASVSGPGRWAASIASLGRSSPQAAISASIKSEIERRTSIREQRFFEGNRQCANPD